MERPRSIRLCRKLRPMGLRGRGNRGSQNQQTVHPALDNQTPPRPHHHNQGSALHIQDPMGPSQSPYVQNLLQARPSLYFQTDRSLARLPPDPTGPIADHQDRYPKADPYLPNSNPDPTDPPPDHQKDPISFPTHARTTYLPLFIPFIVR